MLTRTRSGSSPASCDVESLQAALSGAGFPSEVVSTSELVGGGASRSSITRAARAGLLRRLATGLYGPPPNESTELELAARFGTLSHTTAASLLGLDLTAPPGLHVISPHRRRTPPAGLRIHRGAVPAHEITYLSGQPTTDLLRTVIDCARLLPLRDAVVLLDSAARAGAVTEDALGRATEVLVGPGSARARRAAGFVDHRSGSALESVTRLLFLAHGLEPELQVGIYDGAFVARVDFLFRDERLVVETDGFAYHRDAASFQADRRRHNALLYAGFRVVRFSWSDVLNRPDYVIATVKRLLSAAG